ncbi:unnamed protein product, partial [Vitis vinifera]
MVSGLPIFRYVPWEKSTSSNLFGWRENVVLVCCCELFLDIQPRSIGLYFVDLNVAKGLVELWTVYRSLLVIRVLCAASSFYSPSGYPVSKM